MRTSRLSQAVAVALLTSVLAGPAFATEYYTVDTSAPHWWNKVTRSVKHAATTVVRTVTGKGNGQWTAVTTYPDGSTRTTTGGN